MLKKTNHGVRHFANAMIQNPVVPASGLTASKILLTILSETKSFIAGGAARVYLAKKQKLIDYLVHTKGDIDIFFNSVLDYETALEIIERLDGSHYMNESPTGICTNYHYYCPNIKGLVKFQLVKAFSGDIPSVLETFDFHNSMAAISRDVVIYSSKFFELERKNTLSIESNNSPLFFHRVFKYIAKRGLSNLTESSREFVTETIIKAIYSNFEDHLLSPWNEKQDILDSIEPLLSRKKIIKAPDLLLLVGKMPKSRTVGIGYSSTLINFDPALEEMKSRFKTM